MDDLGWLSEYSVPALRSALRAAGAGWDELPIELTGTNDLSRPAWASGSATIDGGLLAKFAFSEPTAKRLWHEARVLEFLGERPGFNVPGVLAASPNPACLATQIVDRGVPLSYELVRGSIPERVDTLGAELARFLANLHAGEVWDERELRLLLVAEFEATGVAAPEYDFRVIPSFEPGVELLTSTIRWYMALTGRRLSLERIMALHVRTSLGDALWRSKAGLPMLLPQPGGGTPADYVDELAVRFALLGIEA